MQSVFVRLKTTSEPNFLILTKLPILNHSINIYKNDEDAFFILSRLSFLISFSSTLDDYHSFQLYILTHMHIAQSFHLFSSIYFCFTPKSLFSVICHSMVASHFRFDVNICFPLQFLFLSIVNTIFLRPLIHLSTNLLPVTIHLASLDHIHLSSEIYPSPIDTFMSKTVQKYPNHHHSHPSPSSFLLCPSEHH